MHGVPCGKKYDKCEDCPMYTGNKTDEEMKKLEEEKADLCAGACYSLPSHMNFWENTSAKWNPIYGEGSQAQIDYLVKNATELIYRIASVSKKNEKAAKRLKSTINSDFGIKPCIRIF
jgi:hypothetical protein